MLLLEETRNGGNETTKVLPQINVLVEEEPLVRKLWAEHFLKKGRPIEVFENPLEFLRQIDRFSGRGECVQFYFDQDFGRVRGVGLELARAVSRFNARQSVFLVTNYHENSFKNEIRKGLIQKVFGKYPKVIFGVEDYLTEQLDDRNELRKLLSCVEPGDTAIEQELRTGGHDLQFSLEEHFPARAPKPKSISVPVIAEAPPKQESNSRAENTPKNKLLLARVLEWLASGPIIPPVDQRYSYRFHSMDRFH